MGKGHANRRPDALSGAITHRSPPVACRLVTADSDLAELSTLRTLLDEMTVRVERVADRYRDTPDSAIAADLYAAERGLIAAGRSIDRTVNALAGLR